MKPTLMYTTLSIKNYLSLISAGGILIKSQTHKEKKRSRKGQKIKRSEASSLLWKNKYKKLKKSNENHKVLKMELQIREQQHEIARLKSRITGLKYYYKRKYKTSIADQKRKDYLESFKNMKEEILRIENENEIIKENLEDNNKHINTKEGQIYNTKMRMCVYYALAHETPVEHVGDVIQFICKTLTGKYLEATPCKSTIANMAREMGLLSDMQGGSLLATTPNICMGMDATSLGGDHINGIYIAVPKESDSNMPSETKRTYHTMSVSHLPGGRTADYIKHTQQTLTDSAKTYSNWQETDLSRIEKNMKKNITCTITDKVAVNHCVLEELKEMINPTIMELNCNVHPLDSLASKARATLKESDVRGKVYGRESPAVNVITALSKIRYKQGKGDPAAFKSFSRKEGIKMKLFPRYVGNRIHILFHLAGIYIILIDKLLHFLKNFCSPLGGLTSAILQDLENADIKTNLRCLGLFGKILTSPWMALTYSEEESNLALSNKFQTCISNLEHIEREPLYIVDIIRMRTDVFDQPIVSDFTNLDLLTPPTPEADSLFKETIKSLAEAFIKVLKRQLGPKYLQEPTDSEIFITKAAPTHNMQAERIMAMTDAQHRRAPNATMHFIDAKVKVQSNHTMPWLNSLSATQQNSADTYALQAAPTINRELKRWI